MMPEEATYQLCKVREIFVWTKGIPHLVAHGAGTIHQPDALIKVKDIIQTDLETGRLLISSGLTLVICIWCLEVLAWEELV